MKNKLKKINVFAKAFVAVLALASVQVQCLHDQSVHSGVNRRFQEIPAQMSNDGKESRVQRGFAYIQQKADLAKEKASDVLARMKVDPDFRNEVLSVLALTAAAGSIGARAGALSSSQAVKTEMENGPTAGKKFSLQQVNESNDGPEKKKMTRVQRLEWELGA